MKSVVMICHWFPPEGNAGVYRPLRFVRHLPNHGWHPVVITEDPDWYERHDPSLLALVPSSAEVIKVRNPDPWKRIQGRRNLRSEQVMAAASTETAARIRESQKRRLRSVLRDAIHGLEALAYRPDPAMFWIRPATITAAEACKRTSAKVIWATGGPWSSLVVARNVSIRTNLPYVLDFRDSWTLTHSDFEMLQPEWIKARDRRLLSRLFSDANAVVFRYRSEAEAYWRAYHGSLDPAKIHIIPNGYDGSVNDSFNVSDGERCTVLYTGTVGTYWYDTLLDALARLKELDPGIAKKLRLIFVGESTEALSQAAARRGISDIIEVRGVVPFTEANELQSRAHALLLLGWKPARGSELGGSKIFGYLKAGRPIIAVLPRDEQSRILRSLGITTMAYAGSRDEIIAAFKSLLDAWEARALHSLLPDRAACEMYSAAPQTRALVRALEGLPAEEPFKPGVQAIPPSLENLIGPEGWVKALGGRRVSSLTATGVLD